MKRLKYIVYMYKNFQELIKNIAINVKIKIKIKYAD